MLERQIHLVRHGEVYNPEGVLYGRLPGFRLSELGELMAESVRDNLQERGRKVSGVIASPLLRAQQSAAPIAKAFDLPVQTDPRIIEPSNQFEGLVKHGPAGEMRKLRHLPKLWNPLLPSWGEPYARIARRVLAAMDDAWEQQPSDGDAVLVSHQAVIWAAHRAVNGLPLFHNPAQRRCDLSSITSFTKRDGSWFEVCYSSPAEPLLSGAKDVGAV
ncbi:histidine phosphatase family protein [Leucobacter sp. OH1287]|uniref:histidine phosphatase family protein n=1 Tax=Leucobacter sp. OH1287 TaxID=2491049 RepID=UPI000F5EEE24|nr:histidine phosphatase family protein [Leucobacter sp. OH1287]RRD59587.1 histidine phosphatase family protein [Leucobacter sp. OH1287]